MRSPAPAGGRTRFERRMSHLSVTVVGAGRAGSFACMSLGMAGVPRIRVHDPDVLDPDRNLGVQLYRVADVLARRRKVEALRELLMELHPGLSITAVPSAFPPCELTAMGPVVLLAVDTMEARRRAAEALARDTSVHQLVDLRLGGSVLRCHSRRGHEAIQSYSATLYADEAAWDATCADSPDPQLTLAAAAFATSAVLAFVRGGTFPEDLVLDLGSAPCLLEGQLRPLGQDSQSPATERGTPSRNTGTL